MYLHNWIFEQHQSSICINFFKSRSVTSLVREKRRRFQSLILGKQRGASQKHDRLWLMKPIYPHLAVSGEGGGTREGTDRSVIIEKFLSHQKFSSWKKRFPYRFSICHSLYLCIYNLQCFPIFIWKKKLSLYFLLFALLFLVNQNSFLLGTFSSQFCVINILRLFFYFKNRF